MSVDLKSMEDYFDRLWPICRSLTGDGVRKTLDIIEEIVSMERFSVKSGSKVLDWIVPKEWNIRDAFIITPDGRKIAQFKVNNLHVVNYSVPVRKSLTWQELAPCLHTLPEQPNAIPYVTSYYSESWGFCLSYKEYMSLPREGVYEVLIDSSLENGELIYGEAILPGSSDDEVLFSTYICHPSMANNELSGPLVQAFLYREIAKIPNRRFTYRFVFLPETIGAICYLSRHGNRFKKSLCAGYVLTCCGDRGDLHYKKSRIGDSLADRAMEHVLKYWASPRHVIEEFSVGGSDERQYCSPGFNLPVGSLMRTPYQRYPEYHTSLDNKSFISFESMREVVACYFEAVRIIELNDFYLNTVQYGEPQLGKRGLYPSVNSPKQRHIETHRMMHLLAYADGEYDILEIAEKRNEYALHYEGHLSKLRAAKLLRRR